MEHIIYSSVCKHLKHHGILTPRQHGFRPGFSCETQLVSCINDWAKSLDRGFRTEIAMCLTVVCSVNSTNTVYLNGHEGHQRQECHDRIRSSVLLYVYVILSRSDGVTLDIYYLHVSYLKF